VTVGFITSAPVAAAVPRREPLTVDFAEALAGDFFAGATGFFGFVGIAVASCGGESGE